MITVLIPNNILNNLYADNADVNAAANNYPFGASLAFFTYLIDSIADGAGNLTGYRSLVPVGNGNSVKQQYDETDGGGLYEISFGFQVIIMISYCLEEA